MLQICVDSVEIFQSFQKMDNAVAVIALILVGTTHGENELNIKDNTRIRRHQNGTIEYIQPEKSDVEYTNMEREAALSYIEEGKRLSVEEAKWLKTMKEKHPHNPSYTGEYDSCDKRNMTIL